MNEYNDINLPADFDDLSKHAPLLDKLRGKGDGFVVPENYFGELNELVNAKAVLPLNDGFAVPENYFEELTERIISLVQLHALKNENPFVVPENYFRDLSSPVLDVTRLNDSIGNRKSEIENYFIVPENYFENLTNEITALANLASLKNEEAFEIPEGYFAELDEELGTTLALDNLKQDEGFDVPAGYFDNFANNIMMQVAMEEADAENGNGAPEGYFDTLADRIAERIAKEEGLDKDKAAKRGRIIVFAEVIKRYAKPVSIAASVALVVGLSVWFFNRSNGGSPEQNIIAKVEQHKTNQNAIPEIKPVPVVKQTHDVLANNTTAPKRNNHHDGVNLQHDQVVKVEKKDVLDQVDLLDVNSIADIIISNSTETTTPDENSFDETILNQLNDSDINNK